MERKLRKEKMRGNNENEKINSLNNLRKTRGGYVNNPQHKKLKIKKLSDNFIELAENRNIQPQENHLYPDVVWQKSYDYLPKIKQETPEIADSVLKEIMKTQTFTVLNAGTVLANLYYMKNTEVENNDFAETYDNIISSFDDEEKNVLFSLVCYDNQKDLDDINENTIKTSLLNECLYERRISGTNIDSRTFATIWSYLHGPFPSSDNEFERTVRSLKTSQIADNCSQIRKKFPDAFNMSRPDFAVAQTLNEYFNFDFYFIDDCREEKKNALEQFKQIKEKVYDRLIIEEEASEQEISYLKRSHFIAAILNCNKNKISFKESYFQNLQSKLSVIRNF